MKRVGHFLKHVNNLWNSLPHGGVMVLHALKKETEQIGGTKCITDSEA